MFLFSFGWKKFWLLYFGFCQFWCFVRNILFWPEENVLPNYTCFDHCFLTAKTYYFSLSSIFCPKYTAFAKIIHFGLIFGFLDFFILFLVFLKKHLLVDHYYHVIQWHTKKKKGNSRVIFTLACRHAARPWVRSNQVWWSPCDLALHLRSLSPFLQASLIRCLLAA